MTTTTTAAATTTTSGHSIPPSFRFLNDASRPSHERADSHLLWQAEGAVCWMRRYDERGNMCFDLFPSAAEAVHYALVGRPARDRCYYAMVRQGRPLEWYVDAEIKRALCSTLDTGAVQSLQQDFTTLMYVAMAWIRTSLEALFGISTAPSGRGAIAWMLRADTDAKFSCHVHVPQWVFGCVEDMATVMRLVEDVLYSQCCVAKFPLARMLFFVDAERSHRRRPACITAPDVVVASGMECILDFGVYTTIRHMRMALQSTKPGSANPLRLFQPSAVAVRVEASDAFSQHYDIDTVPPTLTQADLMMNTMIATERAKRRVRMPTLIEVAAHHELATEQCLAIVKAFEQYHRLLSNNINNNNNNNNGSDGDDGGGGSDGALHTAMCRAFRMWFADMWRVYLQCDRLPAEMETFIDAELVGEMFIQQLGALITPLTPTPTSTTSDALCVAVHRCAWYSALITRWFMRPRFSSVGDNTTDHNDSGEATTVDLPSVKAALDCLLPLVFQSILNAASLPEESRYSVIVEYEIRLLAMVLFHVDFDTSATEVSISDGGMAAAPPSVFVTATSNLRLAMLEHYLLDCDDHSSSGSGGDAKLVPADRYRPIVDHEQFEAFWSLQCFRSQEEGVDDDVDVDVNVGNSDINNNNVCTLLPHKVLLRAIAMGSVWQPAMDTLVRMLRRSNVESTTRFANLSAPGRQAAAIPSTTGTAPSMANQHPNLMRLIATSRAEHDTLSDATLHAAPLRSALSTSPFSSMRGTAVPKIDSASTGENASDYSHSFSTTPLTDTTHSRLVEIHCPVFRGLFQQFAFDPPSSP